MPNTTLEIVQSGTLPSDGEVFFQSLTDPDGDFTLQEGETWDFKESWPPSYSDKYFGGIARLICAFANTGGGLIIFGVENNSRRGGSNSVKPNLDKLELAFRQLTGTDLRYDYRRYESHKSGEVDVLLVRKKTPQSLPVRFQRDIESYRANTIWVRHGSEVREAEARDIPGLYCRSGFGFEEPKLMSGQLPPSPATVRSFVGRMQTIDRIFGWLFQSDEPRTFLWGKGGSGKSTIAYEVARNLKYHGKGLVINEENSLEQVIFVSGKSKFLNVGNLRSEDFSGNDFSDEGSLYAALLALGGAKEDDLYDISIDELRRRVQTFFDDNSCFVVIDDIDTLTTAGKEAGIDFLYRVLSRSQKRSKLLYTLRNRPTHSISNSIEVPGLPQPDYEEFVQICAMQFAVPAPPTDLRDGRLRATSEGRPLVIESVIALRRNSGSYEGALSMFDQASGEDVRQYVFEREWQSLDAADRGREVLALMAIYGKPIGFSDLCTISKLEQQRVRDALSSVQEMFLVVDNNGEESTYDLGELTRSFVVNYSRNLDYYELIKARVGKFRATFYPDNPELNRILSRSDRAMYELRHGDTSPVRSLLAELSSDIYPPQLTEDPRFISLRANLALFQSPPALDRARHDFESAFAFRHSPDVDFLRNWFEAERQSDLADSQTKLIYELVRTSKGYSHDIRLEFASKRATFLYNFARGSLAFEPERSIDRLFESVSLHLDVFKPRQMESSAGVRRTEQHARNTSFFLIQQLLRGNGADRFLAFLIEATRQDNDWFFDPLVEPLGFLFQASLRQYYTSKKDLQRMTGRLDQITRSIFKERYWCDKTLLTDLQLQLGDTGARIKRAISSAK